MIFFDTHTHVNFAAFDTDRDDVVKRSLELNTWMVNVGTQSDTSKSAVELAKKYEYGVYAAIGLHPVHTCQQMLDEEESHFKSRAEIFDENVYETMLNDKVVAVGECGLDYFRIPNTKNKEQVIDTQKTEFIKQLQFAKKYGLPVIIHCRDAYEDILEILTSEYRDGKGVIHSFTDTWETAKKFLDLGFYVALNGILTFDKTGKLAEVAKNTPLDCLLVETDAPYLTPSPHRGKRNEPGYVNHVATKVAEIKSMSLEQVADQTFNNARKLFRIQEL